MAKHIGIVGVSPEGSSFCYRLIGRRASEIATPEDRPLVSLHNRPFSNYLEALKRDDWATIAALLAESARVLSHAGAQFCVLPDNVAHHALPMAEGDSPVPFLNMVELVADAIQSTGCAKVGVIGTKFVTYGSTYQSVLGLRGIKLLVSEEPVANAIDHIIFSEAVFGRVRPQSRRSVGRAIAALRDRGCEAVILGSSEAALLLDPDTSELPLFDPVEILAEAAIEHALGRTPVG